MHSRTHLLAEGQPQRIQRTTKTTDLYRLNLHNLVTEPTSLALTVITYLDHLVLRKHQVITHHQIGHTTDLRKTPDKVLLKKTLVEHIVTDTNHTTTCCPRHHQSLPSAYGKPTSSGSPMRQGQGQRQAPQRVPTASTARLHPP